MLRANSFHYLRPQLRANRSKERMCPSLDFIRYPLVGEECANCVEDREKVGVNFQPVQVGWHKSFWGVPAAFRLARGEAGGTEKRSTGGWRPAVGGRGEAEAEVRQA